MIDAKYWLASLTIVFNAIVSVVGLIYGLGVAEQEQITNALVGFSAAAIGLVNIGLRFRTRKPIRFKR